MIGSIAAKDNPTLSTSSPPARIRCSGSSTGAPARTSNATGTAMRKTAPHQKVLTKIPPTTGPAAIPDANMVAHTPIANARCRASVNMVLISDRVEGISVAPATPRSARATISHSVPGANAAKTEAVANAATPIISNRRRPIRSPKVPMVTRNPAMKKPYASMIHSVSVALGSRSTVRLGTTR